MVNPNVNLDGFLFSVDGMDLKQLVSGRFLLSLLLETLSHKIHDIPLICSSIFCFQFFNI